MRALWIWAVLVLGNFHLLLSSRATKGVTVSEPKSRRVENLSFHMKLDLVRPINVNDKETEIERSAIIVSNRHVHHRIAKRNANSSAEPSESPVISPVCQPENSCSGRCTNSTEWRTELKFACSCDPDCYEVFNDCCADYEQYCGRQNPKNVSTKKYNWTCEETGNFDSRTCTIGEGTWLVSQCGEKWPNDDTRTKCETPLKTVTRSSSDLRRFLPVMSPENVTFRNLYCGLCNEAKEPYESWPVDIQTTVIPPKSYSLEEKIHFLLSHRAHVITSDGPLRPKSSQPRRYCVAEIKSSCHKPSASCNNGPIAVVSAGPMSYRNIDCAVCNGAPSLLISCFPKTISGRTCLGFSPQPFLLVLDYQRNEKGEEKSKWSVKDEPCGSQGEIYDDILEVCRANWLHPPDQNGQERFYVIAWLAPQRVSKNNGFSPGDFQNSFAKYFDGSHTQILNISISSVRMPFSRFASGGAVNSFYLVSSTIILTPEQSLKLLSGNGGTHNTSKPSLLNFIYFKETLSMVIIKNTSYTIVKTTSRPLACAGKTVYTPMEYTILDQDKIYIDTTNTTYERSEYFRENSPQSNATLGNITVCKKYIPTGCNATWTILAPQQFTVMNNLSVYHKKTSSLYHYGEYDVLSNNSVAVCIQSTYTKPKVVNKAVCSGMVTILVGAGLEGHATMIKEIAESIPRKPSVVVVAVGGGGLLSGVLRGLHDVGWQDVPVVAMETEGANCFAAAVQAGKLVTLPGITSIAKCLGAKTVCEEAYRWTSRHRIISSVVSDKDAVTACLKFADEHQMVVSPSCGAALSAVYSNVLKRLKEQDKLEELTDVVVIVCGGSGISLAKLQEWKDEFEIKDLIN